MNDKAGDDAWAGSGRADGLAGGADGPVSRRIPTVDEKGADGRGGWLRENG